MFDNILKKKKKEKTKTFKKSNFAAKNLPSTPEKPQSIRTILPNTNSSFKQLHVSPTTPNPLHPAFYVTLHENTSSPSSRTILLEAERSSIDKPAIWTISRSKFSFQIHRCRGKSSLLPSFPLTSSVCSFISAEQPLTTIAEEDRETEERGREQRGTMAKGEKESNR